MPARAMDYSLLPVALSGCDGGCSQVILAEGRIGEQEHARFAKFLSEQKNLAAISRVMVINSPGGFNSGAFRLASVIRHLKMTVLVGRPKPGAAGSLEALAPGFCASACVLVLAGGEKRVVAPGSKVGVHRSHTGPNIIDPVTRQGFVNGEVNSEAIKAAYQTFFKSMGVSEEIAAIADRTPSESMYWLSAREMTQFRLVSGPSGKRKGKS